ncbi:MAG: peroxiredoxin [Cyclobacteriaceae bacterium]|jgi:peroxiredoxin
MALTPSNMLELGTEAPPFNLENVLNQKETSFQDVKGEKGTLIMFICAHCPYVIHVQEEIAAVAKSYSVSNIGVVGISSNDIINYPQDDQAHMKQQAEQAGFNFPYLFDATQSVAKAYDAACTPDFYLFDADDKLVYRGRLDESRPGNNQPVSGKELRAAIDLMLVGKAQADIQYPSIGCNIKWKD